MSKALVIKGANFLANRIEQIVISYPIPCTGISLSQSTITFSTIGATATLTATLTPADTTEALTWVSSDDDVATVTNGVVTCVGIGTATITATCGEQIATCAVTASVEINLATAYHKDTDVKYSGSVDLNNNKDWIGLNGNSTCAWTFYSTEDTLGGYQAFIPSGPSGWAGMYLMPIPQGAKTIKATFPNNFNFSALIAANSNQASNATTNPKCAAAVKATRASTTSGSSRVMTLDISDVPTANGFIFSAVNSKDSFDASTVTGDILLTFS